MERANGMGKNDARDNQRWFKDTSKEAQEDVLVDGLDSDEALEEGTESDVMGPDQRALGATRQCKVNQGIKLLPGRYFSLPTALSLRKGTPKEFIHFTNTNRWESIGHDNIKAYVTKLGIPKEIEPTRNLHDRTCLKGRKRMIR